MIYLELCVVYAFLDDLSMKSHEAQEGINGCPSLNSSMKDELLR